MSDRLSGTKRRASSVASSSPERQLKKKPSNEESGILESVRSNGLDEKVDIEPCTEPGSDNDRMSISADEEEDDLPHGSIIPPITTGESLEWQKTIEKVVKSVVAIQFASVVSFDTDPALVSEATGFVVDSERGIIMTNRHVVGAGPFTGYVVFDNHEECDVIPIYRDPVHDFGFLKFDPKKIKYMDVQQLDLRPELAKVGCEIRVIGNDAGEKLSILAGFISRLDRNAPAYGDLTYSDFNTEYIQAAASASGGSSGSPVVNIDGNVVALQAGGATEASTDFFLPLFRGQRALKAIQNSLPVTRGTIQVQWLLKPYDECRRLGLTSEAEKIARHKFPDRIGMLVAETVLPEGPSDGSIEEGDILISINGENMSSFVRVDEILDDSVGGEVEVVVQRGGDEFSSTIAVGDLHSITPDRFVEVAGALFQNLSYQLARLYAIPCKGVHICEASGSFKLDSESKGWILDELDDKPVADLDEFVKVMREIPDGQRVAIKYRHIRDLHSINYSIAYIDRHWHPSFRMAIRNDVSGLWDFQDLGKPLPKLPIERQSARFTEVNLNGSECAKLTRSFVKVATMIPLRIEGFPRSIKNGYGLVIDAEQGLVVVSRNIVPFNLSNIAVTIAESVIIPGKVVFLHPVQNYAIIKYDPQLIDAPIETAKLATTPVTQGLEVMFMGHNHNLRFIATETRVTDVTTVTIPPNNEAPRFRAINLDAITVDTPISVQCGSGILADKDGTVRALHLSCLGERTTDGRDHEYRFGLDVTAITPVIEQLKQGIVPKPRFLDIEVNAIQVVQARIRGVAEEWIRKVEDASKDRHQFLNIMRVATGTLPSVLQEGDIILAIDGKLFNKVAQFEEISERQEVEVTVVRNKEQMILKVPTVSAADMDTTDRVVLWCGAVLHPPHHAVRQQIKKLHSGVYVSGRMPGSPAYQYSIAPTNFITHVNGKATPTLDAFMNTVRSIPDNTYIKLGVVTFDSVKFACSLKTNYHYFPTAELRKNKETSIWESYEYKDGVAVKDEV